MDDLSQRLRRVVAQTFGLPLESVNDDTSPDSVPAWDSVGQLELVSALEQEFSITFDVEDIMLVNRVGDVRALLAKKNQGSG
jgi:acyl carrier protein